MNDREAIASSIKEFIEAYNSQDLAKVLAYYSDDLVKIRNGGGSETKAETAKRVAAVFEQFHSQVEVSNDEVYADGNLAFTRGTFTVTLTPKAGGESQVLRRRYFEIWRKQDGRWLVARAMDNVDN
jgi:uncharacterized protein (TIGR02246 family)